MESWNTHIQVQKELLLAKQSRQEGNEGRARVCARRAAGAAVKQYLEERDMVSRTESALQSLIIFRAKVELPERIEAAVSWLTRKVDQNYNLPGEIDLINEANLVLEHLDKIEPGKSKLSSD